MVSDETVQEFKDAVKSDYGVDLSSEEAAETLRGWVSYFDLLSKIDSRSKGQTS